MKTLILAALLVTAWFNATPAQANIAFVIEGELVINDQPEAPFEMYIKFKDQKLVLDNVHVSQSYGCANGQYEVVSNYHPQGTYTLLAILECASFDDKEAAQNVYCPKIFQPVCGQPQGYECPAGMNCLQVEKTPRTYENLCELENAGAELLFEGDCSETHRRIPRLARRVYRMEDSHTFEK